MTKFNASLKIYQRESAQSTGTKPSDLDQTCSSWLPRTTIHDLVWSGWRFLYFLTVRTHQEGRACGEPLYKEHCIFQEWDIDMSLSVQSNLSSKWLWSHGSQFGWVKACALSNKVVHCQSSFTVLKTFAEGTEGRRELVYGRKEDVVWPGWRTPVRQTSGHEVGKFDIVTPILCTCY